MREGNVKEASGGVLRGGMIGQEPSHPALIRPGKASNFHNGGLPFSILVSCSLR